MDRLPRQVLRGSCLALIALALGGVACDSQPALSPAAGSPVETRISARDFETHALDGRTVRLSDYVGKKAVLVDFWATYCQPCLGMFPHVRRIHEKYKGQLVVLAVSMDQPESVAQVPSYVERNGLRDFVVLLDEDSHVASLFNPRKVEPFVLVYDRRGKLVLTHESFNTGDEVLIENAVKAAVQ